MFYAPVSHSGRSLFDWYGFFPFGIVRQRRLLNNFAVITHAAYLSADVGTDSE